MGYVENDSLTNNAYMQTKLYYAAHKTTIECPNCGQRHSQNNLHQTEEVTDGEEAITQVVCVQQNLYFFYNDFSV